MIRSFKDLEVYQESYQLVLDVYQESRKYPREEQYGLSSQIQRAAVSIPLNIAEGYGKQDTASEFKRYLRMALGSVNEIIVLLDLSRDLGYMDSEKSIELNEKYSILAKRMYRLIDKWRK